MHAGGAVCRALLAGRNVGERQPCDNAVLASTERSQHPPRVGGVLRLAEHLAVQLDHRVGTNDDPKFDGFKYMEAGGEAASIPTT